MSGRTAARSSGRAPRDWVTSSARVAQLSAEDRGRLFGVRYYLGRKPSHPGQVALFEGRSGVKIFRHPRNWTPLWTEHEGAACAGAGDVRVESRRSIGTVLVADMRCAGTVVTGGKIVRDPGAPPSAARIEGGESHKVTKGDIIIVPAGSAHMYREVNGTITYLEVRFVAPK